MVSNPENLNKEERRAKYMKALKENAVDTPFEEVKETDEGKEEIKEDTQKNINIEKENLIKRAQEYKIKKKFYNEEKIRLNNLLQILQNQINQEEPPTEKAEVKSDVDKIIEEIPIEEKEVLKSEMKSDSSMEFESPKIKNNYKDFIKNNVVKLVSGFKISSKIKNIIEKNTKKILLTTAILTMWTSGGSFVKPNGVKGDVSSLKNKEILNINKEKTLETIDIITYSRLSENEKRIYLYASSKIKESYIIIDKPSATLSIIGSDKKLICQIPVLLGQMKGETPNIADPESDVAENATTPAGKYTLGKLGICEEDAILYKGKLFNIHGSDGLALHITYPLEKEKRTKALNTETTEDNRLSWGCINISEEMWDKYMEGNIKDRGSYIFITPDNPISSLNPETGQVEEGVYSFSKINNFTN